MHRRHFLIGLSRWPLTIPALGAALPAAGQNAPRPRELRTPIDIIGLQRSRGVNQLTMSVVGASAVSQVVVLVGYTSQPNLAVALNAEGRPELPRTTDRLPESSPGSTANVSRWTLGFVAGHPKWGQANHVMAIVCTVPGRPGWSRSRDYLAFSELSFGDARRPEVALRTLLEVGWQPTGYTRTDA
jgi:hypothetical protein